MLAIIITDELFDDLELLGQSDNQTSNVTLV